MRRAWPVAATGPSANGMKQDSPRLRSRVAAEAARRVQVPSRQSTMRGPVPGRASAAGGAGESAVTGEISEAEDAVAAGGVGDAAVAGEVSEAEDAVGVGDAAVAGEMGEAGNAVAV